MDFNQHGTYSTEQENDILFINAVGPFNKEFIQALKVEIEQYISTLNGPIWGQVLTLHGLSLLTPEAEKTLVFSLKLLRERGLIATAIIPCSSFSIVKEHISGIYALAGATNRFFDDKSAAKEWMKNQLKAAAKLEL